MNPESLAVYPIVDLTWARHQAIDAAAHVAAVVRAGATLVQLRDKGEHPTELLALCQRIRALLQTAGIPLVVNDRVDLALACDADGVHLGQTDMAAASARRAVQTSRVEKNGQGRFIVGVSVATLDEGRRALEEGADYLSVSPVFGTSTKPQAGRPVGLEGIRTLRAAFPSTPLVAIGGIRPARVREVIHAGADGVAFVSALGTRPGSVTRQIAEHVRNAQRERHADTDPRRAIP
jgi:thiamine-phosphate pyrophosphorylase